MSNGRFSIIEAVKQAWIFTVHSRGYLLRIGFLPLVLQAGTALVMQSVSPNTPMIEAFVWMFPANLAFAWFMFAEIRFLLLGERLDRLPQDPAYLAERRHAMQTAVILLLLFNTAAVGAGALLEWSVQARVFGVNRPATMAILCLLGLMLWALRFSVLHILAAVGYPLRGFIKRVRGPEFSLRLMAMGVLCALPIYAALGLVLDVVLPGAQSDELSFAQMAAVVCIGAPAALLVPVVLNAAAGFALKEMLGRERGR